MADSPRPRAVDGKAVAFDYTAPRSSGASFFGGLGLAPAFTGLADGGHGDLARTGAAGRPAGIRSTHLIPEGIVAGYVDDRDNRARHSGNDRASPPDGLARVPSLAPDLERLRIRGTGLPPNGCGTVGVVAGEDADGCCRWRGRNARRLHTDRVAVARHAVVVVRARPIEMPADRTDGAAGTEDTGVPAAVLKARRLPPYCSASVRCLETCQGWIRS